MNKRFLKPICIYILVLCIFTNGCGHGGSNGLANNNEVLDEDIEAIIFGDVSFSLASDTVTILDKEYKNIWQYSISPNERYLITSEIRNHNQPNIYLYDLQKNTETQLSDNDYINYCCVVNDNGVWAYATYNSNNICEVSAKDKKTIKTNPVTNLVIDDINNLYLATKFNHTTTIQKIDYDEMVLRSLRVLSDLKVTKLFYLPTGRLLLQAFDSCLGKSKVYVYDVVGDNIKRILEDERYNSEILRDFSHTGFYIDCFENYSSCIYSYLELIEEAPSLALSDCNNFQGRLSWNISYKMEAFLRIYRKTKHEAIKKQLLKICNNILNNQNSNIGIKNSINTSETGWAAKKYSLDYNTLLNMLVADAKVLYPLLLMANTNDLLPENMINSIRLTAIELYNYYEDTYQNGHYKFRKGCAFWCDGIIMPWNQQNAFGLCCIELYKLTGDIKYKNRAIELAKAFKKEIVYSNDKIVWYYWPLPFYDGWNEEENLSVNTPSRKPTTSGYEDYSHAGINVKFITEVVSNFPDEVFSENDMKFLMNTANSMIDSNSFFSNLYIDSEAVQSYEDSYPIYGWSDLNSNINAKFNSYIESGNIFFDNEAALIYLSSSNLDEKINLDRYVFDNKLNNISVYKQVVDFDSYFFPKLEK